MIDSALIPPLLAVGGGPSAVVYAGCFALGWLAYALVAMVVLSWAGWLR